MILYIFLIIATLLPALISILFNKRPNASMNNSSVNNRKGENLWFIIILFILWLLTAFRSENIGNDTQAYISCFKYIANNGISDLIYMEKGYQALCYLISLFTKDPHIFLITVATITYTLLGLYIHKYSKNSLISSLLVLCICFSPLTNVLRQGLAMVLCLYVYEWFKEKKYIKAALLLLVAMSLHVTAIALLLVALYKILPRKPRTVFIASTILLLLSITGGLTNTFIRLFPQYNDYFYGARVGSGLLAITVGIARSALLYYYAYINEKDKNVKTPRMAIFVLILFFNCLGTAMNLLTRVSEYFLFISVSELPNIYMGTNRDKTTRVLMAAICILYALYFITVLTIRPDWNNLYPYSFWSS